MFPGENARKILGTKTDRRAMANRLHVLLLQPCVAPPSKFSNIFGCLLDPNYGFYNDHSL